MHHLDVLELAGLDLGGAKTGDAAGKFGAVQIANPQHVDRLVVLEGGPEDGFVQARDLATGAPLRVRLEDLRAQPSVVESELNRRMELVHERSDGEWQRALDNFALLQQLLDDENGTLDQRVHKAAAARSVALRCGGLTH